jgi:hypothetical protein
MKFKTNSINREIKYKVERHQPKGQRLNSKVHFNKKWYTPSQPDGIKRKMIQFINIKGECHCMITDSTDLQCIIMEYHILINLTV